ncbi:hypothetical protein L208DRAFT_1262873, partial [Tricholoma matsutake]
MKLQDWLSYCQACLLELLWHDGLASHLGHDTCSSCQQQIHASWKCLDCIDGGLSRCRGCLLAAHASHPLHWIEQWNGFYFCRSSLCEAGFHIQLGHDGAKCISPISGPPAFTVTDLSGVHRVAVDFCDC